MVSLPPKPYFPVLSPWATSHWS